MTTELLADLKQRLEQRETELRAELASLQTRLTGYERKRAELERLRVDCNEFANSLAKALGAPGTRPAHWPKGGRPGS